MGRTDAKDGGELGARYESREADERNAPESPKGPERRGKQRARPKGPTEGQDWQSSSRRAQGAAERKKVESAEQKPRSPKRNEHTAHKVRPKERKRGAKAAIAEAK